MNVADTLFIGFDDTSGDITVLTVAKRIGHDMHFINVFQGDEARTIYRKLSTPTTITPKEGSNGGPVQTE